ncbi:MAG: mechanosensitive ion channel family protein [Haloferacaceae archaeon]
MSRRVGITAVLGAGVAAVAAGVVDRLDPLSGLRVGGVAAGPFAVKGLLAVAVVAGLYGAYRLLLAVANRRLPDRRRRHDLRNLLRLATGIVGVVAVLGVFTEQWLGVLVSFGVVGFAVTFALQQPLLSLIAWVYIMTARPYAVGDRIEVGDASGDVISVDFLVTTLWEIDGGLVSTNQPSGRVVTVPNSVVLSSEVTNFGGAGIPHVWNELAVQVAYETDLAFARETMIEEADDLLGDEMAARIAEYRRELAETPVELEVQDRPAVNVVQKESWVELRLRYLVHPRRGTRVRNELYRRILDRFNENPDRVDFPLGRNR